MMRPVAPAREHPQVHDCGARRASQPASSPRPVIDATDRPTDGRLIDRRTTDRPTDRSVDGTILPRLAEPVGRALRDWCRGRLSHWCLQAIAAPSSASCPRRYIDACIVRHHVSHTHIVRTPCPCSRLHRLLPVAPCLSLTTYCTLPIAYRQVSNNAYTATPPSSASCTGPCQQSHSATYCNKGTACQGERERERERRMVWFIQRSRSGQFYMCRRGDA